MKLAIVFTLILILSGCANLRAIGLSDEGKDAIQGVLTAEAASSLVKDYCKKKVMQRVVIADRLMEKGIDISNVSC